MAPRGAQKHLWWKESVIYQIYPSSFCDTNGDGWGDIPGITSKLDYLKELGVDIVWSSPFFKSPQADMGYDIADYEDIDPRYGTLQDVDNLIAELKKRDMKLMIDLVVNHTSNEHKWFLESRSSKDNSKRDWYIWKPPKYDSNGSRRPPNNWAQILGEQNSAWTWDETTQEYYLSLFTPEQPDLNWENAQVRDAVHNVLRFWLDRGACGFRMDVINLISKVQSFPDADVVAKDHEYQPGFKYFANGPRLHEWLREINQKVLSKYDTTTVGEMPFIRDEDEIIKAVGADSEELRMIFIFELVDIDNVPGSYRMTLHPWDASDIARILSHWQRVMLDRDGWNSVFIENHDNPRSVSRYCDDSDQYRELGAKLLCLMQTTLAGTLFVYQGEELGMRNVPASWPAEEYKDIESINYYKKMTSMHPGDRDKEKYAMQLLQKKSRDNSRTPMQWTDEPNAGFAKEGVKPWMRVNDDYMDINAARQLQENKDGELSVYQFWKRGLENRKKHKDVFVYGDFELLSDVEKKSSVFAYKRWSNEEAFIVVLNFSGDKIEWKIPESVKVHSWAAGNYTAGNPDMNTSGTVKLKPWEALLGVIEP